MKNFIDEEKMKKETYESPACVIIEIEVQQGICISGIHDPFEEEDYIW